MASAGEERSEGGGLFCKTPWNGITYRPGASEATMGPRWEEFCRIYRRPVLCLICRHGFNAVDAEDLTHDFLLHFLQSGALTRAHPGKGRFRDYLSGSLNHYLANVRARAQAQKRGGGLVAVDLEVLEKLPAPETASPMECERIEHLVGEALARVQKFYLRKGRTVLFKRLRPFIVEEENPPPYRELAAQLHRAPGTLRSDLKRLRARLRKELGRLRGEPLPPDF